MLPDSELIQYYRWYTGGVLLKYLQANVLVAAARVDNSRAKQYINEKA